MSRSSPLARMRSSYRLLSRSSTAFFCCIFWMLSTSSAGGVMMQESIFETDENMNSTCRQLNCQNSNACQTEVFNDTMDAGERQTSARCLCRGKWAGLRCELELRLSFSSAQSEMALLKLRGVDPSATSPRHLGSSGPEGLQLEEITVFVWNSNTSDVCLLLQRSMTSTQTGDIELRGLEKGQKYLVCVANGHMESCSFFSHSGRENLAVEPNCIAFVTPVKDSAPFPFGFVVVPCAVVVFLIILGVLVYLNRRTLLLQLCLHVLCCRCCRRCRTRLYLKQSNINRRMRKQMREVSGDVLMPEDTPVDFEEFEGEDYLSSSMYTSTPSQTGTTDTLLHCFRSLPSTLLDGTEPTGGPCVDPTALLYENQNLISPIYSPQQEDVLKLAFLEDDWASLYATQPTEFLPETAGNTRELGYHAEKGPEFSGECGYFTEPEFPSIRHYSGDNNGVGMQPGHELFDTGLPLMRNTYLSQPDVNIPPYLFTLPEKRFSIASTPLSQPIHTVNTRPSQPFSFSSQAPRLPKRAPATLQSRELESHSDFDLLHSPRDTLSVGFPSTLPFPMPTGALSTGCDVSPEIEYSDASGDHRYPPVFKLDDYPLYQKRRNSIAQHRRSSVGHSVQYRYPRKSKSMRYNRPLSMPADHLLHRTSFLTPPVDSQPSVHPITHPLFHSTLENPSTQNFPFSYIPNQIGYRRSIDHGYIDSRFWCDRNRIDKFSAPFSLNKKDVSLQQFRAIPNDPLYNTGFATNTLPRSKKPKFPNTHVTFNNYTGKETDLHLSNTLPRARVSKPSAFSKSPRRPEQLSLRTQALNLFPQPSLKAPCSLYPAQTDSRLSQDPSSTRKSSDGSLSTSGSSSKSSAPKQVKSLINHFETSLFFRKQPKASKTPSEEQEFLDLQSPLAEERTGTGVKRRKSNRKKMRPASYKKSKSGDFTSLADESYKCFFQKDDPESIETDERSTEATPTRPSSILGNFEEQVYKIKSDTDSSQPIIKSVSTSGRHSCLFPRYSSISCFAEETVNLVTPFCTDDGSPGQDADGNNICDQTISTRASLETLRAEREVDTHEAEDKDTSQDHSGENVDTERQPLQPPAASSDFDTCSAEPRQWEIVM